MLGGEFWVSRPSTLHPLWTAKWNRDGCGGPWQLELGAASTCWSDSSPSVCFGEKRGTVAMGWLRSVWVGRKAAPGGPRLSQNQLPKIPQKPGRRWGAVRGAQGCGARSEGKAALGGVSHTLQVGQAGILDHGRRPAHQHQRLLLGRRQVCPDHVLIHEALAVVPGCRHKRGQVSTPAASPPQGRGRSLHSLTHSLNRSGN